MGHLLHRMVLAAVNADRLPSRCEEITVDARYLLNEMNLRQHRTRLLLSGLNLTCNLLLLGLGVDCGVKFLVTCCTRHDKKELVIIDNNVSKFDCSAAGAVVDFVRFQYFTHDSSFTT